MYGIADKLISLFIKISNIGVYDQSYSDKRRTVLCNQIAFLGTTIPQLYNLFYIWYDAKLLIPAIIVNLVGSLVCFMVMVLNYFRAYLTAKVVISISPNIQIFLLTYYLSTATGMHLLHIMMVSFLLFLFSNERKILFILFSVFPVLLFGYSYYNFLPESSPILLDPVTLKIFYMTISITVFLLVMAFFHLFYREILYTEDLLQKEHQRSEKLLLNILPEKVAQELKENPKTIAEIFPGSTILFADIVGFTGKASVIEPDELIKLLNSIFTRFDTLVEKYDLEKIKTIGDAYMVAGGILGKNDNHIRSTANFALDIMDEIKSFNFRGAPIELRVGFHIGSVIAGVIGTSKFSYDIWGDAVNIASRLESHGVKGRIHVSPDVKKQLSNDFNFESRGKIPIKGIGEMETFFLTGKK